MKLGWNFAENYYVTNCVAHHNVTQTPKGILLIRADPFGDDIWREEKRTLTDLCRGERITFTLILNRGLKLWSGLMCLWTVYSSKVFWKRSWTFVLRTTAENFMTCQICGFSNRTVLHTVGFHNLPWTRGCSTTLTTALALAFANFWLQTWGMGNLNEGFVIFLSDYKKSEWHPKLGQVFSFSSWLKLMIY